MKEEEDKKKEKLKILFCGDLVVPTGFSQVLHNIINPNLEEFDITGLGVNYKGDPHKYTFPVYPAMVSGTGNVYGLDRLVNLLKNNKFDVLFILNDAWVISYYLDAIKKNLEGVELPKIVVYFPVDSLYHNRLWYKDFDIVTRAFTYTEFGRLVVEQCVPEMVVEVLPHGVNSEHFFKTNKKRSASKVDLFGDSSAKMGNLEESFIVLNGNRNQPRKKLDVTIEGFSMFAQGKPQGVRLYMHTGVVDSSVDIRTISKRFEVDDRIIMTNLSQGIQRIPLERLNQIYNACDVGINTSLGEGWGLVNTEHAVTGAPQIVPRHSACAELFSDCGILMEPVANITFDNSQTVGKLVSPEEVARALEILYKDKELRRDLAVKSIKKFTSKEFQWTYIASQWADVFREVTSNDSTISTGN
jgi:glycosyltransferase involved in cell wall biosynthesis